MSHKKNKLSRREFLANSAKSGLALAVYDTILASLVSTYSQSAMAAPAQFKNFIHLNMYGSPPRWMFDLILNPENKAASFMANKQVANIYTGSSRYTGGDYKLINYDSTGIYVPYLLGLKVPTTNGGTTKKSMVQAWNILDHMIQIRGIDVLNAAHQGASNLHQAAVVGAPTLTSVTADRATTSANDPTKNSLRAMVLNPNAGSLFKSDGGNAQFSYSVSGAGNALANIFSSMRPISRENNFSANFINNSKALADKTSAALDSLDPGAKNYYRGLLDSSGNAVQILNDESIQIFSDLKSDWEEIYTRYEKLVREVLVTEFKGINDKAVGQNPKTNAEEALYSYSRSDVYSNQDKNKQIDVRIMLASANLDAMAAQFAVTEFLVTRGICPSISLSPVAMKGLNINGSNASMSFDQHYTGIMPGICLNSLYFLSFSSCLLELIGALKAKKVFDDTLIYWNSEFNRSPRNDGSGSDHASRGAHVNLISGRINQFKLLGNIYVNGAGEGADYDKTYQGTWGHGAPLDGRKEPIKITQVWGSVMNLLGYPKSSLPNLIQKDDLIFDTPGSFTVSSPYNKKAKNINNGKNKA